MTEPEPGAVKSGEVTRLLHAWSGGDKDAGQALMPLVYIQLHAIAMRQMSGERPSHTLCPTALVHEAWLRLDNTGMDLAGRSHFLALASTMMRRILVDHARTRSRAKRFGGLERVSLNELTAVYEPDFRPEQLIDLDRALTDLARQDSRKGRLMEMTYFGGMTPEESAAVLQTTVRTVQRDLRFAKAWLKTALEPSIVHGAT